MVRVHSGPGIDAFANQGVAVAVANIPLVLNVLVLSRSELPRLIAPGELTNQITQFSAKIVV